jgi:hypothetical protein
VPIGAASSTGTTNAMGNGILRVLPWLADSTFTLGGIGIDVTAIGNSGCTIRPVIYANNNGIPTTLLLDAGPLAADAVAMPIASVSLPIVAGTLYWLGAILQGAATTQPTTRIPSGHTYPISARAGSSIVGTAAPVGYAAAGYASGAAPNPYPTPVAINSFGYRPYFRVA